MARKEIAVIVDDLDGTHIESEGHRPTRFSIAGKSYVIDLSPENRETLEEALSPYIENGRRTGHTKRATKRTTKRAPETNSRAIREWARQNGYTVAARGILPHDIVAAYESAH